jgi:hypothetical protein
LHEKHLRAAVKCIENTHATLEFKTVGHHALYKAAATVNVAVLDDDLLLLADIHICVRYLRAPRRNMKGDKNLFVCRGTREDFIVA